MTRALRSLTQQNCSIKFKSMQMGSNMEIDLPIISSRTYGCTDTIMANEETGPLTNIATGNSAQTESRENYCPKRTKLVRGLQKTADKYLQCHFKKDDPRTERLCERVHIALHAATLGVDVHGMVLHYRSTDYSQPEDKRKIQMTNEYIIPPAVARGIMNCVAKGLRSLRNTLSAKLKLVEPIIGAGESTWLKFALHDVTPEGKAVYPKTMPGEFDATLTSEKEKKNYGHGNGNGEELSAPLVHIL
ncbi:hypothetical protein BD769DRAFT_1393578 [Suillus cothurnatus]|nr:hypothetical protein BD769DRAFT_1393578 [Suillus cothurnatus]